MNACSISRVVCQSSLCGNAPCSVPHASIAPGSNSNSRALWLVIMPRSEDHARPPSSANANAGAGGIGLKSGLRRPYCGCVSILACVREAPCEWCEGALPPTASLERVLGGGGILHPLSSNTAAAAGGLLVQQAWRCWESSSLLCSGAAKGRARLATVAAECPACRVFAYHVLFAELLPGGRGGAHRGCTSCHRSRRMCAACCQGW